MPQPDGFNINEGVGATHPDTLASRGARGIVPDFGIAVDGDADRLVVVDAGGRIYNGDELLYVIVRERLMGGPVAGAVGTLMSNLGLEQALARRGVGFARANVGDRYVLELLQQNGWLYGSESSGHLLCSRLPYPRRWHDQRAAGAVGRAAQRAFPGRTDRRSAAAAAEADQRAYPEGLRLACASGAGSRLKCRCRGQAWATTDASLIRPSGTEPLLRVMVEARDEAVAEQTARRIAESISA